MIHREGAPSPIHCRGHIELPPPTRGEGKRLRSFAVFYTKKQESRDRTASIRQCISSSAAGSGLSLK